MIVVGYDLESSQKAVKLAEAYPNILFAVVGVHPHDSKDWNAETANSLKKLLAKPCVVALGEIGLDFHHNFSPRSDQYVAFREQMEIAHEANLPVVIHCREAYAETLEILKEMQVSKIGGVMHCWAGDTKEAEQTIALGMMLGFGGTLTYKNAEEVRNSALITPQDRILLETDAPYLTPLPHRGKRNEPAYTRLVAEKMAELLEKPLDEIAKTTTENAYRLFPRMRV